MDSNRLMKQKVKKKIRTNFDHLSEKLGKIEKVLLKKFRSHTVFHNSSSVILAMQCNISSILFSDIAELICPEAESRNRDSASARSLCL